MGECLITRRGGETYKLPILNGTYPTDITLELGSSVTSKVVIDEDGNPASYFFQWYRNGVAIEGANNQTYNYTPTATGNITLYCEVENSAGIVRSRTATITTTGRYLYDKGSQKTTFYTQKTSSGTSVNWNGTYVSFGITTSSGLGSRFSSINTGVIDLSGYTTAHIKYNNVYGAGTKGAYLILAITSDASPNITAKGCTISDAVARNNIKLTGSAQSGELTLNISNISAGAVAVVLINDSYGYNGSKSSSASVTEIYLS